MALVSPEQLIINEQLLASLNRKKYKNQHSKLIKLKVSRELSRRREIQRRHETKKDKMKSVPQMLNITGQTLDYLEYLSNKDGQIATVLNCGEGGRGKSKGMMWLAEELSKKTGKKIITSNVLWDGIDAIDSRNVINSILSEENTIFVVDEIEEIWGSQHATTRGGMRAKTIFKQLRHLQNDILAMGININDIMTSIESYFKFKIFVGVNTSQYGQVLDYIKKMRIFRFVQSRNWVMDKLNNLKIGWRLVIAPQRVFRVPLSKYHSNSKFGRRLRWLFPNYSNIPLQNSGWAYFPLPEHSEIGALTFHATDKRSIAREFCFELYDLMNGKRVKKIDFEFWVEFTDRVESIKTRTEKYIWKIYQIDFFKKEWQLTLKKMNIDKKRRVLGMKYDFNPLELVQSFLKSTGEGENPVKSKKKKKK